MKRLLGCVALGFACQLAAGLSLVCLSTAAARDLYVNNVSGDDRNDGTNASPGSGKSGPCRSIRKALQLAIRCDRIVIAKTGQPYAESLTLQGAKNSGLPTIPFQVVGNGAMLLGTEPMSETVWHHVAGNIFRMQPDRLTYQQLFRDGVPLKEIAVSARAAGLPKLAPLEWCLYKGEIYLHVEQDKLPENYDLSMAKKSVGITLYNVQNVVITDLIVQGFLLDGVNCHDNAFNCQLAGLTCRGNGRSGISVGGASQVTVEACLIGNNREAQVRSEGFSETVLRNCDLVEGSGPTILRDGGTVKIDNDLLFKPAKPGAAAEPKNSEPVAPKPADPKAPPKDDDLFGN